ncbi:MAG: hypothetical protein AB2693_16290 [Candidatus Thiodiazotropha sp.]
MTFQTGNEEWVLVHWQVLLRLLAKVQPPARLKPLRELFRLTPEEEASLQRPPLAFDSHCHLDRCRSAFRLPRTASLQQIYAYVRPDVDREVTLEGVVASFCDPDTYPFPEEVCSLTDQGCFVVVGIQPKKGASEQDCARLLSLLELPEDSGLGEIGAEQTMPVAQWTQQTDNVERAISELGIFPNS